MEHKDASSSSDTAPLWTLTDGHAGNVRQAEALARALDLGEARPVVVDARRPWRWVAPRRWPSAESAFGPAFKQGLQRPPTIAIGCGRQAALATRLLRERGACSVQILDPRIAPHHWDWVIAPTHDRVRGANVIPMVGSLNPIDDDWLAQARSRFAALAALPGPRTAVLIGGDSAHARLERADAERLMQSLLAARAREHGSLLITASRRTSEPVRALLRAHAPSIGLLWIDERDGENPYAGLLAWADRIVCTADSVNMVSEACATHAPVRVFEPERVDGRPRRFLDDLLASGRIAPLQGDETLTPYAGAPLRETARVAALLRTALRLDPAAAQKD